MRGKHFFLAGFVLLHGITPAGAGKTILGLFLDLKFWDHPRRCGENRILAACYGGCLGSPPQVRGKHICSFYPRYLSRITPAGAGKTTHGTNVAWGFWDHPRRCGENADTEAGYSAMIGSPPQVRGKRRLRLRLYPHARITPAGAGKTRSIYGRGLQRRDHPRRCGENNSKGG